MTMQVIYADEVLDGELRMYAVDAKDADTLRGVIRLRELHRVKLTGYPLAIVDRPAPPTSQPPPVLDLDALERAAKTTSDYDGDACFRVGSAENAAAEEEVAAAIVTTLDAAPHLIAEARAAVVLRQELAEVAHMLAMATSRYDACVTKLAEARRLGLEACDAAQMSDDQMMWAPINITAIRAALEAM